VEKTKHLKRLDSIRREEAVMDFLLHSLLPKHRIISNVKKLSSPLMKFYNITRISHSLITKQRGLYLKKAFIQTEKLRDPANDLKQLKLLL